MKFNLKAVGVKSGGFFPLLVRKYHFYVLRFCCSNGIYSERKTHDIVFNEYIKHNI